MTDIDAGSCPYCERPFYDVEQAPLRVGELVIDPVRYRVTLRGKQIHLTATEFRILLALAERAGRVVRYATLYTVLATEAENEDKLLKVHVCKMRVKFGKDKGYIRTVWNVGHMLEEPECGEDRY